MRFSTLLTEQLLWTCDVENIWMCPCLPHREDWKQMLLLFKAKLPKGFRNVHTDLFKDLQAHVDDRRSSKL